MSAPFLESLRGLRVHLPLLHLVIPGDPVSQGNPQHFQNGGTAYPKATRVHRAYVEMTLAGHWAPQPPIDEPVILRCDFHFPRPVSHFGSGRNRGRLKASAPIWHAQQPDTDKLCRLVMDALTKSRVWADDKLAGRITGEKHWTQPGFGPRTEITILRRDPMDITEGTHSLQIKCPDCGQVVQFPLEIAGRRTSDGLSGSSKLKPSMSTKAVDHTCGVDQEALDFGDDE